MKNRLNITSLCVIFVTSFTNTKAQKKKKKTLV